MKKNNFLLIFGVLVLSVIGLSLVTYGGYASYQCGWSKSFLYGKNTGWAYMMGYCDE